MPPGTGAGGLSGSNGARFAGSAKAKPVQAEAFKENHGEKMASAAAFCEGAVGLSSSRFAALDVMA
jgi:hypothetical protein